MPCIDPASISLVFFYQSSVYTSKENHRRQTVGGPNVCIDEFSSVDELP